MRTSVGGQPCVALGAPRKPCGRTAPTIRCPVKDWKNWWDNSPWKPFFQRCLAANQGTAPAEQRVWRVASSRRSSDDATARRHGIHSLLDWPVSRASYYRHWCRLRRGSRRELRDRIQRSVWRIVLMVTVACEQLCASRASGESQKVRR